VIRQGKGTAYVPAVLRNNLIPTKVLVETANLNNATDRERLADPEWRQDYAQALTNALLAHF
jgi:N-acetylmuramoyl-L-alanine amidase